MSKKKEFIYICDKCNNQIISDQETILKCSVCGNSIDTRITAWSGHSSKKSKSKTKLLWLLVIISVIFTSVKYYNRKERQEIKMQEFDMIGALNSSIFEENYRIYTFIKLTKKDLPSNFFKCKSLLTDSYIHTGSINNLIINIISYNAIESVYSNLKNSRDTIIKNYLLTIADSYSIDQEDTTSILPRFHSLLTKGTIRKEKVELGFKILSDCDSELHKNWHVLLIFEKTKANLEITEKIMNSRELGNKSAYIE